MGSGARLHGSKSQFYYLLLILGKLLNFFVSQFSYLQNVDTSDGLMYVKHLERIESAP